MASDMFAVLADTVEKKGVVCGFLGTVRCCVCVCVCVCVCASKKSLLCIYSHYRYATHSYSRNQKEQEKIEYWKKVGSSEKDGDRLWRREGVHRNGVE